MAYLLLSEGITAAVTGVTPDPTATVPVRRSKPTTVAVESIFVYGSGGTTAKVWVQTSLDNGATWFDIVSHAFTTASASKVSACSNRIAPASQGFTPGDGALADNTIIQGVFGELFRAKLTTTGTYAGGTTIAVWLTVW